ncbi:MAG: hypothetical protein SV062_06980, partial [Thermodesulfobacteriota bacterium]|nr:hypothetical protein [Thermodesulfobacteriota bacterium]
MLKKRYMDKRTIKMINSLLAENLSNNQDSKSSEIIKLLLELKDSTTHFLNQLTWKKLQVNIQFQEPVKDPKDKTFVRESWLYFDEPKKPILYCSSNLYFKKITGTEANQILNTSLPLGSIFDSENTGRLRKGDIKVDYFNSSYMTRMLN